MYTLELRDDGYYGFELPPGQILPTGQETWAGIRALVYEAIMDGGKNKHWSLIWFYLIHQEYIIPYNCYILKIKIQLMYILQSSGSSERYNMI